MRESRVRLYRNNRTLDPRFHGVTRNIDSFLKFAAIMEVGMSGAQSLLRTSRHLTGKFPLSSTSFPRSLFPRASSGKRDSKSTVALALSLLRYPAYRSRASLRFREISTSCASARKPGLGSCLARSPARTHVKWVRDMPGSPLRSRGIRTLPLRRDCVAAMSRANILFARSPPCGSPCAAKRESSRNLIQLPCYLWTPASAGVARGFSTFRSALRSSFPSRYPCSSFVIPAQAG